MSLKQPTYLERINDQERRQPLLCLHGLNQQPNALKPLSKKMEQFGYSPYLLHLPGHRFRNGDFNLDSQTFLQAYKGAYDYLCHHYNKAPVFLGYSFGGLIGVHYSDLCAYEKMILLAPALEMRTYAFMIKMGLPFLNRIYSMPIGTREQEKRYRYHQKGVPSSIYRSFFSIYSENQKKDKDYLKATKAIVFCHPYDELVSYKKLKRWVASNTSWKFETVDNRMASFSKYNHLCFDLETLGESSYQDLLSKIQNFMQDL